MQWHLCRRLTGSLPKYLIILKGRNSSNVKVRVLLTHDIRPKTDQGRRYNFTITIIFWTIFILRTTSLQNNLRLAKKGPNNHKTLFDFVIASTAWDLLTVMKRLKIHECRGKITFIGIIVSLLNTFWITEYLEERQRVDLIERLYYINVIYVLFVREWNVPL